jgi:hypothetical protein
MESSNPDEEVLKDVDIKQIKNNLREIYQDIRYIQTESKFSFIRQQTYNEVVQSNDSYNFYMTMLESVVFIGIAFAQLYYIKHLLEHKRMI